MKNISLKDDIVLILSKNSTTTNNYTWQQPGLGGRRNRVNIYPGQPISIMLLFVWYVFICECPSISYDMLQITICMICYELQFVICYEFAKRMICYEFKIVVANAS